MKNEFANLKQLETEYLHLLKISPQGKERIKLFESKSIPMEKIGEHIIFLENEIVKLKEELSSDGVDVNSYLENDNFSD